jgi:two-component system alkaline phosphatase synthesis response regulator PhoP
VVHAQDGEEAMAIFPTSGASMLISDVEMPRMDGLALLAALRAHPAGKHLPVMMLTAMGDENYVVRAFELGADDYVLKPFSAREVTARIRRMLRRPTVSGVPVR